MKKKEKEVIIKCKSVTCTNKSKKEGFCASCYPQFKKGLLDFNGDLTQKAAKKVAKQKEKEINEIKSEIIVNLKEKPKLLKVLQTSYPETTKAFYCEKLQFFNCEAACFNRMFLWQTVETACQSCHVHDSRLPWFKDFVKNATEST